MHFKVINDDFYSRIKIFLKNIVPQFEFDETDEPYLILFEFSQFMIANIDNQVEFSKCCTFINEAISKGNTKTEDAIVMQVFQPLFYNEVYIERSLKYFCAKSRSLFEKSHIEFMKDFS
jgi:hypothetical protein